MREKNNQKLLYYIQNIINLRFIEFIENIYFFYYIQIYVYNPQLYYMQIEIIIVLSIKIFDKKIK